MRLLAEFIIFTGILALVGGLFLIIVISRNDVDGASPIATSTMLGISNTTTSSINQNVPTTNSTSEKSEPVVSNGSTTAALLRGMKLTFDDEFNSFSRYIDDNGNVTCKADGSGTWQTVYNFCSRTNSNNNEAEVYTDPGFYAYLKKESNAQSEIDPENPFTISNGSLAIRANPSSSQVLSAVGSWAKYTSGMITTQFSFSQTYGYFEMRAKMPAGSGLWPAFWLLPEDGTWPPEIDAMEFFGATSPGDQGGVTMIHYASHSTVAGQGCGNWYDTGVDLTQGFHTYGVDIEPTGITYYFDGLAYAHCPANSETNKPFYIIINLAVGGPGSWPGTPDSATIFPAYLYVDYVRAYAKD